MLTESKTKGFYHISKKKLITEMYYYDLQIFQNLSNITLITEM